MKNLIAKFLMLWVVLWFSDGTTWSSAYAHYFTWHVGKHGHLGYGCVDEPQFEEFLKPSGVKLTGALVDGQCTYGKCPKVKVSVVDQ